MLENIKHKKQKSVYKVNNAFVYSWIIGKIMPCIFFTLSGAQFDTEVLLQTWFNLNPMMDK